MKEVKISEVIDKAERLKRLDAKLRYAEQIDFYHSNHGIDTEEIFSVAFPCGKNTAVFWANPQQLGLTHDEIANLARMVHKRLRIQKSVLENWFKERGISP